MDHKSEVLKLLGKQIGNEDEVAEIRECASAVVQRWVDPSGKGPQTINGLVYGLIQSGKTGVLTVTGAMGADEGYQTVLILTTDIEPLYRQTFGRIQEAFPGMDVIGKHEFRDGAAFIQRVRGQTCAIVTSKNANMLNSLIQNFRVGRFHGLSCLIIDDEADQASLNTRASRDDGTRSRVNEAISDLRGFFARNTYIQVTATPQALFLQIPVHEFRPQFTVLSQPGADYVGGDDFFGDHAHLVREFAMADIAALSPGTQPLPALGIPASLLRALDTFMVGATFKRMQDPEENCAFLCHVSTRTTDHDYIVQLFRKYKSDLADGAKDKRPPTLARLKTAYDDLASTHSGVQTTPFSSIVDAIGFYSPGITIKLVNGQTDEDVAVRSPYNLFVGGNKLGRGVTIKNLLVSYYGRNPRRPQADTVLQHARMYGYRRKDIGLLRLFLPRELHIIFQAINLMEKGLRELIERSPSEEFRGIFLQGNIDSTRRNVLAPGSIGVYSGGNNYNPAQVMRDQNALLSTQKVDKILSSIPNKQGHAFSIQQLKELISLTVPDESQSEMIWNTHAIVESVVQYASLNHRDDGFVWVDRDRELVENRRETQGILSGGERSNIPDDVIALIMFRTKADGKRSASWWPQVIFPRGAYAFAFSL